MARHSSIRPERLIFGQLPVRTIQKTLHLELEPGPTVMSSNAQIHAARRHPSDFPRCLPHVASVVNSPLYLGDDYRNPGKIELISRIPVLGSGLLIAVEVSQDGGGNYNVVSIYPIADARIASRREKGFLRNAII